MLNPQIETSLNDQIGRELASSYLYLSMAAYFEARDLSGASHWMRAQAREELGHAMKIFDYVHLRGGRVNLGTLAAPRAHWETPIEVFEDALEHERAVTGALHSLERQASEQADPATRSFLQWFVDEQVEEEAQAEHIVRRVRLVGQEGLGLLALDRELGGR